MRGRRGRRPARAQFEGSPDAACWGSPDSASGELPGSASEVSSAWTAGSSLAAPAGVTMTFTTGPNAAHYPPAGIKVEKMGDAPEGFVKYRIVS